MEEKPIPTIPRELPVLELDDFSKKLVRQLKHDLNRLQLESTTLQGFVTNLIMANHPNSDIRSVIQAINSFKE